MDAVPAGGFDTFAIGEPGRFFRLRIIGRLRELARELVFVGWIVRVQCEARSAALRKPETDSRLSEPGPVEFRVPYRPSTAPSAVRNIAAHDMS